MKYYEKAPADLQTRIDKALEDLLNGLGDVRPMLGMIGCFRLRMGDYRIIFKPNEQTEEFIILKIGSRGDIYKK